MRACLDKEFPNHGLTAKEERDYVVALTMFDNDFDTNLYCKDATPRTKRLVIALIRAAYEDHGHVDAYLDFFEQITGTETTKLCKEFVEKKMGCKLTDEDYLAILEAQKANLGHANEESP